MRSFAHPFSLTGRILLGSCSLWLSACREGSGEKETVGTDNTVPPSVVDQAPVPEEATPEDTGSVQDSPSPEDEVSELRREIESRQQTIEDLQAAVEMERAKLVEDPDYDRSFLQDVQEEQQELRDAIKADENRLEELSGSGE